MTPEEKFGETHETFELLVAIMDDAKIYATDDGKPRLPALWKCAKELTKR